MSNTLIIDSLNTLFSMSNTAVIGAQEQFVAFMNPAAQELFREVFWHEYAKIPSQKASFIGFLPASTFFSPSGRILFFMIMSSHPEEHPAVSGAAAPSDTGTG